MGKVENMSEKRKLAILLTNLECIKETAGAGYDEVYFMIWADDTFQQMYPKNALYGDVSRIHFLGVI